MGKDDYPQKNEGEASHEGAFPAKSDDLGDAISRCSSDRESDLAACRVCHCVESDKRGDIVLGFLGITPPFGDKPKEKEDLNPTSTQVSELKSDNSCENDEKKCSFVEFVSPTGEIFICNTDLEMGFTRNEDSLIELGCHCKSDLALVHYACALKWFVNHGSTICEICGCVAKNIKAADFKKIVTALKDYEVLRERTVNGVPNPTAVQMNNLGVDPDAVAAIRRQRLSEISLWFNPYNHSDMVINASVMDQEQARNAVIEGLIATENPTTKWAVEGTGILLATGLLTVTLTWLIAPRVGKKTARSGLHILLGGICALTVVVFFRFVVLTRIRYGPARYWAILFIFWFLVFGIWASRTHGAHTT